ncbi:hypothetical protein [Petrocella sp. FN5]|uniref:hypothetical protein n=1 Tax=Petrocella sp. FN5 TaxID=3032002 RepID=UPI0023D9A098|nr:hypothetical protein [Petrocella sp. FN5]MDF1616082.1 hypothetical protein [Petrocella sp. FN5]
MLELLLFFAILGLILSLLFKVSIGIIRLALGIVGVLLFFVLIPVGLALIIPIVCLAIAVGIIRLIF